MNAYFLPGMMGLLMGLLLHWTGFSRSGGMRHALGLRRSYALRSGLTALGLAMALTALLMWLAVIDVDTVEVLPLSLGALLGGGLLGAAAGLCGFTPLTAFAGIGAGRALEALCVVAGCFGGGLLLRTLGETVSPLHTPPYAAATVFEVTLDEPFLLGGGFLGQGCAGLLLWVIALCIPSPRPVILTEEEIARRTEEIARTDSGSEEAPVPEEPLPPEENDAPDGDMTAPPPEEKSGKPEDAAADTFVSLLEGEEPLIVDMDAEEQEPE